MKFLKDFNIELYNKLQKQFTRIIDNDNCVDLKNVFIDLLAILYKENEKTIDNFLNYFPILDFYSLFKSLNNFKIEKSDMEDIKDNIYINDLDMLQENYQYLLQKFVKNVLQSLYDYDCIIDDSIIDTICY